MATIADGMAIFRHAMQYSWLWFNNILIKAHAVGWWFGMFFTFTIFRLFIFPLLGTVGSDTVNSYLGRSNSDQARRTYSRPRTYSRRYYRGRK